MSKRSSHSLIKRTAIDIAGFGLIIISPFLGWIPGPGGIPVFLAGLGILSLNYDWADNLLKDFEKKRLEFVETYLMGNKKVARTIDSLSILIMAMGVLGLLFLQHSVIKFMSIGFITLGLFILISNQKRLDKLVNKINKKRQP